MTGTSVFDALDVQHEELGERLDSLNEAAWGAPSRCEGWTVADVVLHLAQTDEFVIAGCTGNFGDAAAFFAPGANAVETVDDAAALAVEHERGAAIPALLARWRAASDESRRLLRNRDPSDQIPWVIGTLAPRTLATTRLAESWIHAGDIASPEGDWTDDERLWHIARLAWRTLPYAYARASTTMSGPVRVVLSSSDDETWSFEPDEPAVTTVRGPALDWCLVAARRRDPATTSLRAEGADRDSVLSLARTYA